MIRDATLAAYGIIVVLVVALEASRAARKMPTLRVIATDLLARPTVRFIVFCAWAWLGWHLFVRGSVAFLK